MSISRRYRNGYLTLRVTSLIRTFIWQQRADWPLTCCNSVIKQLGLNITMIKNNARNNIKHTMYVSVSQGDIHTKFTWQKFNKNTLETDLLNLSNPEKSVVSAGKLFHMLITSRMMKKLRLLKVKYRCLCNIGYMRDRVIVTGFLE